MTPKLSHRSVAIGRTSVLCPGNNAVGSGIRKVQPGLPGEMAILLAATGVTAIALRT